MAKAKHKLHNWIEPDTGVVHLGSTTCGSEYTLCGVSWDFPSTELGQTAMEHTTKPCTCKRCVEDISLLLPYLNKESKRINANNLTDSNIWEF